MGPLPGEEVPASRKTASVVGREGGVGGPTHQAREDFQRWGEGSADLLVKMILYIEDPWGWEMARERV